MCQILLFPVLPVMYLISLRTASKQQLYLRTCVRVSPLQVIAEQALERSPGRPLPPLLLPTLSTFRGTPPRPGGDPSRGRTPETRGRRDGNAAPLRREFALLRRGFVARGLGGGERRAGPSRGVWHGPR